MKKLSIIILAGLVLQLGYIKRIGKESHIKNKIRFIRNTIFKPE